MTPDIAISRVRQQENTLNTLIFNHLMGINIIELPNQHIFKSMNHFALI
jgi:hypothetical protein